MTDELATMTDEYTPPTEEEVVFEAWRKAINRDRHALRRLTNKLVLADHQRAQLRAENAELRKAYEPVEKAFRVVWTACAFGYEGTPVGEAFNHIKAWFDGVRL